MSTDTTATFTYHSEWVSTTGKRWEQMQAEIARLRQENERLRASLLTLQHGDGCFCAAAFAMPDGSHPSHSAECEAARAALATTEEG